MDPIARITSNDEFTRLFKALLAAEYEDFQTIDDSNGDRGNDGYSEKERMLFQQYCPEKPDRTESNYKTKIKKDLDKAKALVDAGEYVIEKWVFVTPEQLPEAVQTYIRTEASARGFQGIAWASPKLTGLLTKHSHLRSEFPLLTLPDIEAGLKEATQEIVGRIDSVEAVEKRYKTDREQQYSRKIDDAKTTLNSSNFPAAKSEYESILRDLQRETMEIDSYLFFRTYNNLGVAEENLGNFDVAAELYQKAYEAQPTLPMAIAKHAMAKIHNEQYEEALSIAENLLLDHPHDENGVIVKLNALFFLDRHAELTEFAKKEGKVAWMNWFQAQEAMKRDDFRAAVNFFENVISLEPQNAKAYMYAAQNVLVDSKDFLTDNPLPLNKLPVEIQADFEKAISWLREAITLSRQHGVKADLEMAYTNLASSLGSVGLFKESLEAATEAVLLDPTSQMGLFNKSVSELKLGKYVECLETLKKLQLVAGSTPDTDRHIAFCALQTNDFALAESKIEPYLLETEPLDLSAVEVGIEIYSRRIATEKLEKLLGRLETELPNDPRAIRARANYFQKIGSPEALGLYELALEKSVGDSQIFLAEIDIADCLYEAKEFQRAGEVYEKYTDPKHNNIANNRFAACLFESGQYGKLLKWSKTLEKHVRNNYMVRQAEAYANWTLNNLDDAASMFKDLYEREPSNIGYLVYYGMCQFRLGNEEEAKRSYDVIKNKVSSVSDLAALASGYEFIGDNNLPIELTYKGLQSDPNNPKAHLAFIFTFLRREQADEKEFDEKHVKAFQTSIAEFNTRFPNETALKGIKVEGDDISEILKVVDQISEATGNAQKLYQDSKVPLAFVPRITGKKAFDVWAAFTNMPEVGIKMAFGSADEIKEDNNAAQDYSGRSVVVDIYPLFLLGFLERLDLLEDSFEKIYVHQETVDELTTTIDDQRVSSGKGVTSFAKIDGQHRITEIPSESVKKSLAMLEGLRDRITKSPKFEIRGLTKEPTEDKESIVGALDETARGSVLLAQELNVPLYSDDRLLRAVLRSEAKTKSFSTQALMYLAQANEKLSLSDRHGLQKKLIEINYDFVAIDGVFIYELLKSEGYKTDPIGKVIAYLMRKDTSLQSLVVVFSGFLMLLMRDTTIQTKQKIEIVQIFLKEAKKNHDLIKIEEGVLDLLQKGLAPSMHPQLKDLIRIFFSGV